MLTTGRMRRSVTKIEQRKDSGERMEMGVTENRFRFIINSTSNASKMKNKVPIPQFLAE